MSAKFYSAIGLCNSSGNLISGENIIDAIKKHKVCYVIICEDASDNTKKRLINKCNYYNIDYDIYGNLNDLSHAIGKHRVAVGIKSNGFKKMIKNEIGG